MPQVDATGTFLVGRYRLGRRVGGGGMGAVHEAQDERVGRRVAVKVLHPQLAKEEQHVARFLREAKAAAGLMHPHIVQVLDVSGEGAETPFLVMEFLSGQSMSRMLKDEGRLTPGRVARLARQLLSALAAAHAVGIVHRDMKPGNIIVQRGYDGREIAKIVDFGIAKLMDTQSYTRLTATGELLGTPAYMAPEQLTAGRIDGRTDLYGVGAIMYKAIAGEPAVGRGSLPEIAHRALTGAHPPLEEYVDIHPGLSAVVERALAVEATERFFEAAEMADALAPFEDPTGAVALPEHLAPPATRVAPSVRPPARPSGRVVPITSERPPVRSADSSKIPETGERSPPPSGRVVPETHERPPVRISARPEASVRPAARGSGRPPPSAEPQPSVRPHAPEQSKAPRRGWALAALAFGGAVFGAVTVIGIAIAVSGDDGAGDTQPLTPVPVAVPMAVVPSPAGGPSPDEPMQPSLPSGAATPETDAALDATPVVESAAEEEPPPPRRRRRRRRPRNEAPSPPSDEPIYTIPADQIPPIGMPASAPAPTPTAE